MATRLVASGKESSRSCYDSHSLDRPTVDLSQMEKMVAIGQLSSSVAHEMRNLLGVIRNAAFNIQRELSAAAPEVQNNLDIINRSVARAREFIDNLLNLSRVSNNSEEVIDIACTVDNLLTLFSKELEWRKIELRRNYHSLPPFHLDGNAFQECLLNLILNAIQCMDEGGVLTITIQPSLGGVRITIADTGCGIPPEDLEKIFDRFYTTKKNGQGTGLGLTIARSIARDLGGEIHVESEVGVGSAFSICLPSLTPAREYPEEQTHGRTRVCAK